MITTQQLSYEVSGKRLLENVTAKFKAGNISIVIGPNGAGKSTLIKLLSQNLTPSSGSVNIAETNIQEFTKQELAVKRAVLSQSIEIPFPLTVQQVVMMGRYPHFSNHPTQTDQKICQEASELFEIQQFLNRDYLTLSGGERQRVHFARVAAQIWQDDQDSTKYLLLDEPLSHLDIYYQFEIIDKLKTLMRNQSIVVIGVLHDLTLAHRFGDHILLLDDGKPVSSGPPDQVFIKEHMSNVFKMTPSFLEDDSGNQFINFKVR